ncbi:MAG: ABC transporter substrate-binding protein [Acetobacteraceae bacterium]
MTTTRNILSQRAATRRKILKFGAAASVLPWVHIRTAGAAGKLNVFFWDHWVPAGNVVMREQVERWSKKNMVETNIDFITSIGQKTLLTINAEAQAGRGHDLFTIANWNVRDHASKMVPVTDVVKRLESQYGPANRVSNYLGKVKDEWVAVPSSWGTQNKGPAARISMLKEYAGIDVVKMYPGSGTTETPEAKAWTMDAMLKAAEACAKAGKPFAIGTGTTADSVDTAGGIFAAFGATLVDEKGKIATKSDAVMQALEYMKKLAQWLPPEAPSFDDASNNRALISGNTALIWNPPSAWAVAVRDAPAVAADTWHFPAPMGPAGRFMPHSMNFFGIWEFAQNKSGAKELAEFLMQIENVDARSTAVKGYDLPPFQKMATSKVWDDVSPPKGTVYNYPVRPWHHQTEHLAMMPAPPEIAVQMYNRGTLSTMVTKLKAGQTIPQVIAWANEEIEGFLG